ncbi:Stp1/IreP family PP2C-type Ser/Thr phosphatase [Natronolimnobius baerhuensis]|uniref:PPM-type phosphatase domain-containing protein n=1 Tax=Natronolimnobius baerhuensis TaxID=253108 RepID=A0A202E3F4_9EURY|nr:Stp1/IreP family PP2C-type Ser/Thr phosphatase [Natronolimnobius baerhuensis]OVE82825.1 hypothetical protein B2G88_18705 [Natronolimnobius baerhuensis]
MNETFVTRTDVGRQREHNEDTLFGTQLTDNTKLLAVADGMGGHAAGDVASQLAIDTLEETLGGDSIPPRTEWKDLLESAIVDANRAIHDQCNERSRMGTTVVVALVRSGEVLLANVGDSRAYTLTESSIEQVTTDQSLVQELVDQGKLTSEEAAEHPQRNVISQALGTDETVEPDFYEVSGADTLLLCSDGLTEEVADETIHELIHEAPTLAKGADLLVERANENGGSDNVSVLLSSL